MMMFTNANEIIQIIEKRKNRGYGLEHFKEYMATLDNPHRLLSSIHIAGTNGKGSTTNYIRSILQAAGYNVGTFTSPYMITHLDRIRINDRYIEEEDFVRIVNTYYESWLAWDLSMFEIDMCIAVMYFIEKQVDFCIFEVGLGGRLDSTNILFPILSVITNIGMDHMEFLGDTYELIAEEKAGIIKDHIDVITGEDKPSCLAIFQQHADKAVSLCIQVKPIRNIRLLDTITFSYQQYEDIKLASQGAYQSKNAALAIEVVNYLTNKQIMQLDETQLRTGLRQAVWLGRFEIIHENPRIILDGAHNAHGVQALVDSLGEQKDMRILFSVVKDKNYEEMLDLLTTLTSDITVCHFQNERALELKNLKKREGITLLEDYRVVMNEIMHGHKTTLITGSLYFISEVRKYITDMVRVKRKSE